MARGIAGAQLHSNRVTGHGQGGANFPELTAAELAPGAEDTWHALTDPARCMSSTTAKAQPASRRAAAGHSGMRRTPQDTARRRAYAGRDRTSSCGCACRVSGLDLARAQCQHHSTSADCWWDNAGNCREDNEAIAATSPKAKAVSKVRWPRPFPHWDSIELRSKSRLRPWTCGTRTNHWKSVGWSTRTS